MLWPVSVGLGLTIGLFSCLVWPETLVAFKAIPSPRRHRCRLRHRDGRRLESGRHLPRIYTDGELVRGTYPDATEVMFPIRDGGGPVLPQFVDGSAGQPVDMWRWRADLQHTGDASQTPFLTYDSIRQRAGHTWHTCDIAVAARKIFRLFEGPWHGPVSLYPPCR